MEIYYLDFGKPFPNDVAGEFVELAYTENFANHPVTHRVLRENVINIPLQTTVEEKYLSGRDELVVVCKPTSQEQIQFSILQPRSENQYRDKRKWDRTGRFFFQRRHMLLREPDLIEDFRRGNLPYINLLKVGCSDGEKENLLIKYPQPKNLTLPLYYEQDTGNKLPYYNNNRLTDSTGKFTLQDDKVLFLSNTIIEVAGTDETGKNQIRVLGRMSIDEKIEIVDAIQRLVYHKLSWICFATDYVTETPRSDRLTILFLEGEDESSRVPTPDRGFESVDLNNISKHSKLQYFEALRGLEEYEFSIVNRALFNPECKTVQDIINKVKEDVYAYNVDCRKFLNFAEDKQRKYIKDYDGWFNCLLKNVSKFSFWKWFDLLVESQRPLEDLVKVLLDYSNEKSQFIPQNVENIQNNDRINMILSKAMEIGTQKQLIFLLEQLSSLQGR